MASNKTHLKEESSQKQLKQRMQEVVDELNHYKKLSSESAQELEKIKAKRAQLEIDLGLTNRKLNLLENDYEQQAAKLASTLDKLTETSNAAAECERQRKQLDSRRQIDEDKLVELEQFVRETSEAAVEAERRYDDVSRKLLVTEAELERTETRAEAAEQKVADLESDMKALASKFKSLQVKVERATKKEELFDKTIDDLRKQLSTAEQRGSESDKMIAKLQRDIDRMQDEVLQTKLQYQSLREELDPYGREICAK